MPTKNSVPPSISLQPWYSQVVVVPISDQIQITIGAVVSKLIKQIYPDSRDVESWAIYLRLRKIQLWNLSGRSCALSPFDLTGTSVDQLGGFMDAGGTGNFPCILYQWPLSQTELVHNNKDQKDSAKVVVSAIIPKGDTGLLHFTVLWRFANPANIPTIPTSRGEQQLTATTTNVYRINQKQQEILSELQQLNQDKPSVLSKLVDGVKVGAEVVSAVADEDTQNFQDSVLRLLQTLCVRESEDEHSFTKVSRGDYPSGKSSPV